jgi:hypothetical protein
MIERAIENWLINTNELSFQIPFCQVLISQGHEILYTSPHGSLEFGKDIISKDKKGNVHAYQLKTGNITLAVWDSIHREVMEDLVNTPCDHPNVDKSVPHLSHLVANGNISDNVFQRIDKANQTKTNHTKLETINKDQLLKMFLDKKGTFLPKSFEGFSKFLELFMADGTAIFPKKEFFYFIQNNILEKEGQKSKKLNSIFSSVILTNNILNNFENKHNYYAKLEAWTVLYFTLIGFIEQQNISDKKINSTMNIIKKEILENMNKITDEFLERKNLLEGMPFGDGDLMYKARVTMILGAVCCNKVYFNSEFDKKLHKKIIDNLKYLWFWGEASFSSLFFIIKYLEKNDLQKQSYGIINDILKAILKHNEFRSKEQAIPNPYYDINSILEFNLCGNEIDFKQFKSNSFILNPLIEMIARREGKKPLEQNWRKISHIQISKFIPNKAHESFYFWNKQGSNYSNFPKQTQSWTELQQISKSEVSFELFTKNKELLPCFFMIYPHRISEELVKCIDE